MELKWASGTEARDLVSGDYQVDGPKHADVAQKADCDDFSLREEVGSLPDDCIVLVEAGRECGENPRHAENVHTGVDQCAQVDIRWPVTEVTSVEKLSRPCAATDREKDVGEGQVREEEAKFDCQVRTDHRRKDNEQI